MISIRFITLIKNFSQIEIRTTIDLKVTKNLFKFLNFSSRTNYFAGIIEKKKKSIKLNGDDRAEIIIE